MLKETLESIESVKSASGKSETDVLIGGLEKPTSGKIIFQNQEITGLNEDEVTNFVGWTKGLNHVVRYETFLIVYCLFS